ncbi:MAG: thermonuclease family protein [Nanoarchaeota archaeon]
MSKKRDVLTLIISVILLIAINYNYLDDKLESYLSTSETALVERVIDGDTIVIAKNKTSVRMLGINTPEKGEAYYKEAKEFLENMVLNKTVRLEAGKEKTDRYGRLLRYIYVDEKDINLELVKLLGENLVILFLLRTIYLLIRT